MTEPPNAIPTEGVKPAAGAFARVGVDLPLRSATAVVMGGAAFAAAYFGGFPFYAFWGVAAFGVIWEWQRLVGGSRLWARVGLATLALLVASPFAIRGLGHNVEISFAACLVGSLLVGFVSDPGRRNASGAGVIYAGALLIGVTLLRASPHYGLAAILWMFATVWGTDVMAYFGGRLIGGPKLWPSISPGKTWSGALVGIGLGALLGTILAALMVPQGVKWTPMFLFGLGVAASAQVGDLFESRMKRRANVKDSSRLIPGHGGLMDRLDGFIFAVGLTTLVAWARTSGDWIAPGLFQW